MLIFYRKQKFKQIAQRIRAIAQKIFIKSKLFKPIPEVMVMNVVSIFVYFEKLPVMKKD
ncbi:MULTISPECIES: hypothetical protein [unclassified Marinitoga]|uniref:hypothetical protein n=1 Tax=unclassified Marinitoga TaxID=2640159 RepID=UPI0012E0BB3C|nr:MULTISPECIES: hypothetical protein [unclassified Marinitoga]